MTQSVISAGGAYAVDVRVHGKLLCDELSIFMTVSIIGVSCKPGCSSNDFWESNVMGSGLMKHAGLTEVILPQVSVLVNAL